MRTLKIVSLFRWHNQIAFWHVSSIHGFLQVVNPFVHNTLSQTNNLHLIIVWFLLFARSLLCVSLSVTCKSDVKKEALHHKFHTVSVWYLRPEQFIWNYRYIMYNFYMLSSSIEYKLKIPRSIAHILQRKKPYCAQFFYQA